MKMCRCCGGSFPAGQVGSTGYCPYCKPAQTFATVNFDDLWGRGAPGKKSSDW